MQISTLEKFPRVQKNKKLTDAHAHLEKLVSELRKRTIPEEVIHSINWFVDEVNNFNGSDEAFLKTMKDSLAKILKLIEKELKLVPKNHYRKLWLALGMGAFGIPFGVVFGLALGNMAFLGIGIPIGMGIGTAIGMALDQKASDSGNQLETEIN